MELPLTIYKAPFTFSLLTRGVGYDETFALAQSWATSAKLCLPRQEDKLDSTSVALQGSL
jgi:hypothetical protein